LTSLDVDTRRIRDAFERDLADYRAPADLAERARLGGLRRARRHRTLAVSVAAAACAAAVTALAVVTLASPSHPGGRGQQPGAISQAALPSAASVSKAMLTAFSAANDDVLYRTETGISKGVVVDVYRTWSWPVQPVPGQQALLRDAYSSRTSTGPLRLAEDYGLVYTTRPASAKYVPGRLTMVCYAAREGGCGYENTQTAAGTWSLQRGRFGNVTAGLDDLGPSALARGIAAGQWRVTGRTRVDGQQAIELTETPAGSYKPLPVLLWVNAHTHLPLRMSWGARGSSATQLDWHYLKPTTANRALLRVPIPAGYPRSTPSKS